METPDDAEAPFSPHRTRRTSNSQLVPDQPAGLTAPPLPSFLFLTPWQPHPTVTAAVYATSFFFLLLHRLWEEGSLPAGPCQVVLKPI